MARPGFSMTPRPPKPESSRHPRAAVGALAILCLAAAARAEPPANTVAAPDAAPAPAPARPFQAPDLAPGLSTGAEPLGDAPGLFSSAPTQVYVTCVASTPDDILRSDLIPLASAPVAAIERRWSRFLAGEGVTAADARCAAPRAAGKAAAYADLDARARRVRERTGARGMRYTGWRY